jgi:hypothetical protein
MPPRGRSYSVIASGAKQSRDRGACSLRRIRGCGDSPRIWPVETKLAIASISGLLRSARNDGDGSFSLTRDILRARHDHA